MRIKGMQMEDVESILIRLMLHFEVKMYKDLASKIEVSPNTIDSWKGRKTIPMKTLKEIAKKENLSLDWLLTGEGLGSLRAYTFSKTGVPMNSENPALRKIPYYDCFEASAGFGAINGDVKDPEYIHLPDRFLKGASSSTEAIKCRGDSMSPSINNGDIMFIDREDIEIKDGEVYVVRCSEELFVKRLFKLPGKIMARSDNAGAGYGEFPVSLSESQILGRVIYRMEEV